MSPGSWDDIFTLPLGGDKIMELRQHKSPVSPPAKAFVKMSPPMAKETPELRRMSRSLEETDPAIANVLHEEVRRQATGLELIPSENFVSEAVMETMGSVLTNKYAEGYPGKRYYGGCEFVDQAEQLAIDRAKA